MDAKNRRAKAKLERRNAAKHIDYDALASSTSTTTSSSSSSSSCPTFDDFSLYTSFRVKGVDGEFDLICRSLGLSGPEDFSIPMDAWESCKARDLTPRSRLRRTLVAAPPSGAGAVEWQRGADVLAAKVGSIEVGSEGRRLSGDDGCELDGVVNRDRVSCRSPLQHEATEGFGLSDSRGFPSSFEPKGRWDGGSGELDRAGGGIKGLRPPVLAPPPVMSRPVVDNVSSTWDLFRSFGPQDDQIGNRNSPVGPLRGEGWVDDGDDGKLDQQRITERKDAPNSCSLASVEDDEYEYKDDVASTVTSSILETEHSVSLNGSFRQRITSWQRGELLGSGSFGTVYEGFTDDGLFFAVKEVSLLDQGTQGKQSVLQLEQEISLLSQFEHDNIVRYLGTDKDDKKLYIFLELVTKGSLAKLYQKYELRDSQVSVYTRQILQGLKYLHEKNVVHRDIKCANILVDASGSVKLADFGLAKATKISDAKSCKGTAFWMAPEVVNLRNKSYGLAADIWSLGCTVLEMLTRRPPYSHLEGMQALYRIGKGEPPEVPDSLSRDARHFILKCLQVNPNNRPTAVQLLDHSFVRKPPTSVGFASPGSNNIWS